MNYAIELIDKEIKLISAALSDSDLKNYPESRAVREQRLKDLRDVKNAYLDKTTQKTLF
jgi:hypothetical protein